MSAQQLLEALSGLMGPLSQPHSTFTSAPESDDEGDEATHAPSQQHGDTNTSSSKKTSKKQKDAAAAAEAAAAAAASVTGSSLAGYAAQLVLTLMESVARRHVRVHEQPQQQQQQPQQQQQQQQQQQKQQQHQAARALDVLRLPLVVRVAQQAPDASVRNAALSLLALLASAKPQAVLSHVLEVSQQFSSTALHYMHCITLHAQLVTLPARPML